MDTWSILWSFVIFYGHFVVIWYIFPPFWYFAPRKIWQPCPEQTFAIRTSDLAVLDDAVAAELAVADGLEAVRHLVVGQHVPDRAPAFLGKPVRKCSKAFESVQKCLKVFESV
jgi:hypothetical protein